MVEHGWARDRLNMGKFERFFPTDTVGKAKITYSFFGPGRREAVEDDSRPI